MCILFVSCDTIVGGESAGHVLPDAVAWILSIRFLPHFLDDADRLEEQVGAFTLMDARPLSGDGKILAVVDYDPVSHITVVLIDCQVINHLRLVGRLNLPDPIPAMKSVRQMRPFPLVGDNNGIPVSSVSPCISLTTCSMN